MAALDIGLIEAFSIIFPFLLVFAIVFALLKKFKILGEGSTIPAITAIVIAFIVILSKDVVQIINFIAPWFVLLFIFILLLLMVYKIFGATDENLAVFIKEHTLTQWVIVMIGVIIIVAGIANVFGQRLTPLTQDGNDGNVSYIGAGTTESDEFEETVGRTIFHPKIVGLILVFLIAAFAIGLLTMKEM